MIADFKRCIKIFKISYTFGRKPVWSDPLHFQEHRVPSSKIALRFSFPTPAEPKFSKFQNCSKNEVSEVILTGSASCSAGDQDCRFPISSSRLFKTFPSGSLHSSSIFSAFSVLKYSTGFGQ